MMLQGGVLNNKDTLDYACGLITGNYKGLNTISHGGVIDGYRSVIVRFPDQKVTVVIFANRADADPVKMSYKVADKLLKDQFIVQKSTPNEIEAKDKSPENEYNLDQLTGNYISRPGMSLKISLKHHSLNVIQSWNKMSYNIARTKGNTFQIPGDTNLCFTFSDLQNGSTHQLLVYVGGKKLDSLIKRGY
ncbi:MAG: hypothetical protein HC905_31850 [Bacteroidales bacterium]|nr:hypothetical protein [Bacteroidales bacterium]